MSKLITQPIREYFYYINEVGHIYVIDDKLMRENKLDKTTIFYGPTFLKERKSVNLLIRNLAENSTGTHTPLFPWLSICAGERNFIRSADRPIVFHSIDTLERK